MEEIIIKLLLLAFLALPFAALLSDMLGKSDGLTNRVVAGVRKRVDGVRKRVDGVRKRVDGARKPVDGPRKPFPARNGPFPECFRGKRIDEPTNTIQLWNITK